MEILSEDYCSYKLAKLLQEKNFKQPCLVEYHLRGDILAEKAAGNFYSDIGVPTYTHQKIYKWLRLNHKVVIVITPNDKNTCWRYKLKIGVPLKFYLGESQPYKSYEEAMEAALTMALDNIKV